MSTDGYFIVNGGYTGNTEMTRAVNAGSLAAVQLVDSVTGQAHSKIWLTAPGAKFPRHEDYEGLDHQERPMDGYFDVGGVALQYPGDESGPPEEVCNCRCAVVYGESGEQVEAEGE